jgi:hypothetical protein
MQQLPEDILYLIYKSYFTNHILWRFRIVYNNSIYYRKKALGLVNI